MKSTDLSLSSILRASHRNATKHLKLKGLLHAKDPVPTSRKPWDELGSGREVLRQGVTWNQGPKFMNGLGFEPGEVESAKAYMAYHTQ